jgi:hypothetical protein
VRRYASPAAFAQPVGQGAASPSQGRLRLGRGRDGCFQPPPAQIRTRSITSYGSYLESNVKAFVWIRVGDAW